MGTLRAETMGRGRRTRCGPPFSALPALRPAQAALLRDWLRGHAAERRWQTLLDQAGAERLELADELLTLLLACGALQTRERFVHAQWRVERVVWADLAALQQALGLATRQEQSDQRDALAARLKTLAQQVPWLAPAARHCLDARVSDATRQARLDLLLALARWHEEQCFGLQRDFAQFARGHTKAISAGEWDWLAQHVALQELGIARFAPLLWLGGTLTLGTACGRIDVAAAGLCGLPAALLAAPVQVQAPQGYWLIENRASFERQALAAAPGTCVVWLPGQPPTSWRQAMAWLIAAAPAPARISCDPDPAGVAIALTAGALWDAAGLPWQPHAMEAAAWRQAPQLPLTAHDRDWLTRLLARTDLPAPLRALCLALEQGGHKAEQEAWL